MGIRRRQGVTFEKSEDTVLILDREGTVLTSLNPVGSVIWCHLDGQRNAGELARDLLCEFDGVDEATLASDIEAFVNVLLDADLVEID